MPANQYPLTEPPVKAILARLEDPAQLNAEITEIQAELTTAGVPADQVASLVGFPSTNVNDFIPPPSYLVDFPAIGIQEISSRLMDDTGHSATGEHRLGVVIFCANPDQELLAWMLRRYAQAVARVLLSGRAFGEATDSAGRAAAWAVGAADPFIRWGPTLSSTSTPTTWMSFCVVQIWCKREEL